METNGCKKQPERVTCRNRLSLDQECEVDMLTKIERREERQKLRGESVCRIIEMNVKVTGDNKFMGSGCSKGEKRTEVIKENREWFGISGRRWRTIDIED